MSLWVTFWMMFIPSVCAGGYWLVSTRRRTRRRDRVPDPSPEVVLREAFTLKRAIAQEAVDGWDREWAALTRNAGPPTSRLCVHEWVMVGSSFNPPLDFCSQCGISRREVRIEGWRLSSPSETHRHVWKFKPGGGNAMRGYCTICGAEG
jgi:hypothetical protein